jgi:hypothetical protein
MPESWNTRVTRWGFNWFPAYRGTGARIDYIASDWREVRIRLPLSRRTRNYVGTIFGGSMYGAVLKGSSRVDSEAVPEGVRLRYRNYAGVTEAYPIGTIEGCCQHYGVEYEIDVKGLSPRDADYLVHLKE